MINKKVVANRINSINNAFDGVHYSELGRRSLDSIYKKLRYKSVVYVKDLMAMQKDFLVLHKFFRKISDGDYVACVIGAKTKKYHGFGTSHVVLSKYHPKLLSCLQTLGKVGSASKFSGTGNIVGKCAEAKAANGLLSLDASSDINDIKFTAAIRPRTMEVISPCPNCVQIFGANL